MPRLLYHFVHLDTLPGIFDEGALLSTNELERRGRRPARSIASERLQERRARTRVPLGGTLHDYVPFYFAPRSPMLFRIGKEWVERGQGDPQDVVYLVSSVERVVAEALPFTFTPYHAVTRPNEFLTRVEELDRVDWALMESRQWADTAEDNDRARRRQAEFLVRDRLPLGALVGYATADVPRAARVAVLAEQHGLALRGKPVPGWYF